MSRLDELFGKETLRAQMAWRVQPLPWWHWRNMLALIYFLIMVGLAAWLIAPRFGFWL